MYKYEVTLRETKLKRVEIYSDRDLSGDQVKIAVLKDGNHGDFLKVEALNILDIVKEDPKLKEAA
jgi:hypothetical protein